MTFWRWSRVANTNAGIDPTINFAEGQLPSTINDSARAMMAATAKWRDDISGVIVGTGTSTAYAVASYQVITANTDGFTVQFTPGSTNTGPTTLSVDSQTAAPLRFLSGVDLPAGVLISGSLYQATYRAATSEWLLHSSPAAAPFLVPLGGMIGYIGATAPNANFVLPQGQAISRATYATLFSLVGTTYGVGDGSTTFNVPDVVGRVEAMLDAGSARLSATYFGGNPANLGAVGGGESKTLLAANLPAYTPSGSISNSITVAFNAANISSASGGGNSVTTGGFSSTAALNLNAATIGGTSTFTGNAQGGTSTPFRTVQPTIIMNKILRVL